MKENLLKSLEVIIASLEKNEVQTIEVRGAVFAAIQFKNALAVIDEKLLVEIVKEKLPPVRTSEPVKPIEQLKENPKETQKEETLTQKV
jgi:hypothetical protein